MNPAKPPPGKVDGTLDPHYYQYVPGYGYFLMPGLPGDKTAGQEDEGESAANVVKQSEKGCACLKEWSLSGQSCNNYCCNPDSSPGDWCFVEDKSCEGDTWGMCAKPVLLQLNSTATSSRHLKVNDPRRKNLRSSFLQERQDYVEGAECDCE